jgi:hypothetical protein
VFSTGPPKEADSLGFEGSGLSPIGISVLRGPSRSVGCRRSCGQPVTTSAIVTSVNVAVKESIHQLDVNPSRIRRGMFSHPETQHLGDDVPRVGHSFKCEFESNPSAANRQPRSSTMIQGDLLTGETGPATDTIGLLFRSPSSCSGS